MRSSNKKWLSWKLPFGQNCDPSCDEMLHIIHCALIAVAFVIALATVMYNIQMKVPWEFLQEYSLTPQDATLIAYASILAFFAIIWKPQRKLIMFLSCRKCKKAGVPVCSYCGTLISLPVCENSKCECSNPDCGYSYAIWD